MLIHPYESIKVWRQNSNFAPYYYSQSSGKILSLVFEFPNTKPIYGLDNQSELKNQLTKYAEQLSYEQRQADALRQELREKQSS